MENPVVEKVRICWASLGISERLIAEMGLPLYEEASELEVAEVSPDGRLHQLIPVTATAWRAMKAAAAGVAIEIHIVSAHRSVKRQVELISRKLESGQSLTEILAVSAPPGCSEHHTGKAVDIGTGQLPPLEADFERTPAFQWLQSNASVYGFELSFPEGNRWGYMYKPWHWCHSGYTPNQAHNSDG